MPAEPLGRRGRIKENSAALKRGEPDLMGNIILGFYGIAILLYCGAEMRRRSQEIESKLDWFFAIVLPLACSVGAFGYMIRPPAMVAWAYLPIWAMGLAGFGWELKDIHKLEGGLNVANVSLALALMTVLFGIGLLFGGLWVRSLVNPI